MLNQQTTNKNPLLLINSLLESDVAISEFTEKLGIKESTLNKYLSILKETGFKFKRKNNKIELFHFSKKEKLEDFELNVFAYLMLISRLALSKKDDSKINSAIRKMLKITSKDNSEKIKETFNSYKEIIISKYSNDKIEIIKKYLNGKKRLILTTKSKEEISVLPIEFSWKDEKIFLKYSNKNDEINSLALDDIVKISKDENSFNFVEAKETIFEITDKLTKTYLLREEERVIDVYQDKIVIANSNPDKEKLFKRLLRYDQYCKVIFPKSDVEKFKKIISDSLANIDGFLDNIE